ncbi:uncharacterized protein LOC143299155 [Babylonia areolata]|uniref:uncharacterized protein LOC143299155 n=1 Tax=Babylonia areolata TaxID=304850 RepID=UPI003FD2F8A3
MKREEGARAADHVVLWVALLCLLGQCVPYVVCSKLDTVVQVPGDRTTKRPSSKTTTLREERSTRVRIYTSKPTLSTKISDNKLNLSKTSPRTSSSMDRLAATTERLMDVSDSDLRVLGTSKPRHPRSTMAGRTSKVFVDSTFSDYALLWITKPDSRVRTLEERQEGERKVEGDSGGGGGGSGGTVVNPAYTWTPAFSPSSRLSGTNTVARDDSSVGLFPTRSPRWRTNPSCCVSESLPQDVSEVSQVSQVSEVSQVSQVSPVGEGTTTSQTVFKKSRIPEDKILYIGGIFELSQNSHAESARSELDAAFLAIRHVNDKGVVPGYTLQLVFNDSKCDAGVATDVFYDMIYRMGAGRHITMVMGSACAEVTKTLAEIVPYWNLILISYAATSPALGDREKYRTFFRLALADSALVPARRMFINNFGWKTVAVLYEDIEKYSLAMNAIGKDFAQNNITIAASLSFKEPSVEIPEMLRELKKMDIRVILGAFSVATARQVFCEAYRQGLYGARYVWLLMGGFKADSWWRETAGTNCTARQLAVAVNGCFAVVSLNTLLGGLKSVANLTTTEFKEAYHANNGSTPMSFFAATTYDTVWTIALTLAKAMAQWRRSGHPVPPLHQMNYSSLAPVRDTYLDIIKNSRFNGVSGPVSFQGSDREGVSVIYQLQGGNFSRVAIHYPDSPRLDFNCDGCRPVYWQGGRVPKDKKIVQPRQKVIEATIFYITAACCGAGIFLALVFLQYNLYHRKLKFIKLSSPKLNNVAVIGCILVYATVILMGLDDRTMPLHVFSVICTVRVFLLAAGFSLSFGAMFAKTFRVHQIFTRANHGLVKSKLLRDRHLLFLIGGLLVVDSGVVCVWVIVDPMGPHVTNLTMESSEEDEDLVFLTQLTTCNSAHLQKWMGAFYAYKGLLLLFGVYMAWETRHVKIPALNDSQYIGFNVYNVVLMSVCVVVLSNILSSQPTLAYAIDSAFMFLSTTVTLCLLFVPKIYVIVTSGGDPVIASTGILVEANTRRFVVDDKKEIFYRAEVQNRVYKREIVELEQEICRLERLLTLPMDEYPKLSEELLYLLPESKVDLTPDSQQRRRRLESVGHSRSRSISSTLEVWRKRCETQRAALLHLFDGLGCLQWCGDPTQLAYSRLLLVFGCLDVFVAGSVISKEPDSGGQSGQCNSISDGGEGVSYAKEEHDDVLKELVLEGSRSQSQDQDHLTTSPMGKRHSTQDNITSSAFRRLRLKNRSFSVSHTTNCTWKSRLKLKTSGPRRKYCRNDAVDGEDSSMSSSSSPSSPADCERGSDKSRFAALLGEELEDSGGSVFTGGGGGGGGGGGWVGGGGLDASFLGPPACGRARSYSASCDRAPTIDKVTQTSFLDSPRSGNKRIGHVFRVDRLEVIEMEEAPPVCSSGGPPSPCHWTLTAPSICSPSQDGEEPSRAQEECGGFSASSGRRGNHRLPTHSPIPEEEKASNILRPASFPEELDSLMPCSVSPRSRSPCIRRANAVHFSPYNEVRFVDRADITHSFLQATAGSPSARHPHHTSATNSSSSSSSPSHNIPLSLLNSSSPCSDSQPGLSAHGRDEVFTSTPHLATSTFKAAQTAIEYERRKRIRKLQHDLQRIQRELQDLDELEYDVTEV